MTFIAKMKGALGLKKKAEPFARIEPAPMKRKPSVGLKQKTPIAPRSKTKRKPAKDFDHMEYVASQPCVICGYWPVEVHHCISNRFSQARAPDDMTIPLCYNHHRGDAGIHTNKALWEQLYGPDTDYLPRI